MALQAVFVGPIASAVATPRFQESSEVFEVLAALSEDRPFRQEKIEQLTGIELRRTDDTNPYWNIFESDRDPERLISHII